MKGEVYVPFGLRSAPIIFSAIADALQWIIQVHGVEFLFHYLDDLITDGSQANQGCENTVQTSGKVNVSR